MTNERFCELYKGFLMEDVDQLKQIGSVTFTGKSLKKFVEFCLAQEQKREEELEEEILDDMDDLDNDEPHEKDWGKDDDWDEDRDLLGNDYDDDDDE